MGVILVNTFAMTVGGFFAESTAEYRFFHWIDYVCVLYYVLEVVLKVRRDGWSGYRESRWNRFDFVVTVLCLPALLEPWVDAVHVVAWLPVFRAGRLFRLLRLLRFIPDSAGLARGIKRALEASVGVFLALALVNLIFALSASFIFGEVDPEHFGDPARSLYTIFQIFTLEGWNEYPLRIEQRLKEQNMNPMWAHGARIFFATAVLVGGVLGFSLANAVFIDEMTLDNNRHLEVKVDELAAEIRQLRALLAENGQGGPGVDAAAFSAAGTAEGAKEGLATPDPKRRPSADPSTARLPSAAAAQRTEGQEPGH